MFPYTKVNHHCRVFHPWDWASSFIPRHGDPFTTLPVLISFNHKSQAKLSVQLGEARARQNGWIFWRKSEGEGRIRKIVQNLCIVNGNFCVMNFGGNFQWKNSERRGGGGQRPFGYFFHKFIHPVGHMLPLLQTSFWSIQFLPAAIRSHQHTPYRYLIQPWSQLKKI